MNNLWRGIAIFGIWIGVGLCSFNAGYIIGMVGMFAMFATLAVCYE